jgi:hypothetical protein
VRFRLKKPKRRSSPEIDKMMAMAEKLTPSELDRFISSAFVEDLQLVKRLVTEEKEGFDHLRELPALQSLIKEVSAFYEDLVTDQCLRKDLSLFKKNEIMRYKSIQARDEAMSTLEELDTRSRQHHKEIFRRWNKIYAINYETLCDTYLIEPAEKLGRHPTNSKSEALRILTSYRNGKHVKIFESLIPQIRNSIQHQDFTIDPRQPEITFYDKKKPPLTLTMEEYQHILYGSLFLMSAFDVAYFDLRFEVVNALIKAIDVVDGFLKRHRLTLKEGGPLSLLDWVYLIEAGKV